MMPRFTLADLEAANAAWFCNCGPSALAAIMGLTLDEVRVHMPTFEDKGYTNPTMMFDALRSIGVRWSWTSVNVAEQPPTWPRYGIVRIQWEGPWTGPGVPIAARCRFTHWVGACRGQPLCATARSDHDVGIWDVNALAKGTGWATLPNWRSVLVPHLTADIKLASGGWHITHAIEVERPAVSAQIGAAP
jgi:hypothetical protein